VPAPHLQHFSGSRSRPKPAPVIERMLTPHSSLAISDTGLGPETGKGTDFIVITR
jgi:hypothetical protein